jgi:TolB protein
VTADADGGRQRVLARSALAFRSIAWSPDGATVAYARPYRDPTLITVVGLFLVDDRPAAVPRFVLRAAGMGEVAWAPDGRTVALAASVPGAEPFDPYRLFAIRLADRRIVQLTAPPGARTADEGPRWSPDGDEIAFTRIRIGGSEVMSVRPDGSGERVLAGDAAGPAWSPAGDRIAFVDGISGGRRPLSVAVMRPDGSGKRRLVALRHPLDAVGLGMQSVR